MKVEGTKVIARLDQAPNVPDFKGGRPDRAPKSKPAHRKGDTRPVDWNDAPEPRQRKPKPEDRKPGKPYGAKPKGEPSDAPRKPRANKSGDAGDGASSYKPRGDGPKGPPPPKGKTSSKKNRVRTADAKAAKGGKAAPKRK